MKYLSKLLNKNENDFIKETSEKTVKLKIHTTFTKSNIHSELVFDIKDNITEDTDKFIPKNSINDSNVLYKDLNYDPPSIKLDKSVFTQYPTL